MHLAHDRDAGRAREEARQYPANSGASGRIAVAQVNGNEKRALRARRHRI